MSNEQMVWHPWRFPCPTNIVLYISVSYGADYVSKNVIKIKIIINIFFCLHTDIASPMREDFRILTSLPRYYLHKIKTRQAFVVKTKGEVHLRYSKIEFRSSFHK